MAAKDKKAGKLALGMKCGDCLHFKTGPKSPLYKSRCSELGVKTFAKACQGYTPNFTVLNRREGGLSAAARIAKLTRKMNSSQKRVLGYLLTKMTGAFDKLGVAFGQPMYLYLEPTVGLGRSALEMLKDDNFNYLDNYYQAYVIGVTDLGDGIREIYLASSVEGKPDYYVSVNVKEGERMKRALTEAEFEKVKTKLEAEGRRRMPKELRRRLEKLHEMKFEEPAAEPQRTIDEIPYAWWESGISADEKRSKRNRNTKLSRSKVKKFKDESIDNQLGVKPTKKKVKKTKLKTKKQKGRIAIRLTA